MAFRIHAKFHFLKRELFLWLVENYVIGPNIGPIWASTRSRGERKTGDKCKKGEGGVNSARKSTASTSGGERKRKKGVGGVEEKELPVSQLSPLKVSHLKVLLWLYV